MNDLTERVVVITGGFGSLGRAVATAFVEHGARIALVDLTTPSQSIVEQFRSPHLLIGGIELTNMQAATTAMTSVHRHFGQLDILVNVAGGFRSEELEQGSIDTWDAMYAMNLKTAVVACSAALPHLLASAPGSRIINIGAGAAGKTARAGMGAYTASKAGVQKLTESLADEVKDRGVTVNAILPGTIDTPQNRADMPDADVSRWVAPAAIADVVAFLASARAGAVTGAAIPVFGRG